MKENLQAINKNTQQLHHAIKEVERILIQLRDCWEDQRDFVWNVLDSNAQLEKSGKVTLSLVAGTSRINGGFLALEEMGVIPGRDAFNEEITQQEADELMGLDPRETPEEHKEEQA